MVVGHGALLWHAEDLGETPTHPGHKRRARLPARPGKTPVISRAEDLSEAGVGTLRVGGARTRQLLRPPVLKGRPARSVLVPAGTTPR
jgi:hypothetical protein